MCLRLLAFLFASILFTSNAVLTASAAEQPNILWLSCEDISAHFGCYGDSHAITPNVDKLATEGIRYTNAYTTAGVCAPCRSGIITGLYQTTLGTHHMRCTATLPKEIKPFPVYLRNSGYYCTNNSKQDYQFKTPKNTWDVSSKKAHWRNRKNEDKSKPFFSVFNFTGCHESGIASKSKYEEVTKNLSADQRQDPDKLELPPYFPDTPIVREDWKRNYELITATDQWAGDLIQQLKDDGLYENTIIFFWSDHGVGLPRSKRWLYNSGTHIPLVVRIPEKFRVNNQGQPGSVNDEMVSSIDLGPTVLNLAGVEIPDYIQGKVFLGENRSPERDYVYGARDRMDERYDIIRMVHDKQFLYIRNYEPLKTFYQYINTAEKGATMKEIRRLHNKGKLNPEAEFYFSKMKPVEELYDCSTDPHNIKNLSGDPKFSKVLKRMRTSHLKWVQDTKDVGLIPEPIIAERVKKLGSEYAILRQANGDQYNKKLGEIAAAASGGIDELPKLLAATKDGDSAIRYWGATGIGNLEKPARRKVISEMEKLLKDSSSAVRTAAARALGLTISTHSITPFLIKELTEGTQWERLHAAIVLDELDERVRHAVNKMKVGLQYQKGFNSDGKYRVRVINRAINELMGTNIEVK